MENLVTPLLTIIASLVASMIWVVKNLMRRSDRLIEQRDEQVNRSLRSLNLAVESFANFEASEDEIHDAIIKRLEDVSETQSANLQISEAVLRQLERMNHDEDDNG